MPAADLTMDLTARSQTSHARRGAAVQHEASRFNFERAGGHHGLVVGPRAGPRGVRGAAPHPREVGGCTVIQRAQDASQT